MHHVPLFRACSPLFLLLTFMIPVSPLASLPVYFFFLFMIEYYRSNVLFTNGSAIYICAYSSIFSKKICTRTQNFFLIMGMIKCTNVLTSILCCSNYGGIETDLQTEWYVVLSLTFNFLFSSIEEASTCKGYTCSPM